MVTTGATTQFCATSSAKSGGNVNMNYSSSTGRNRSTRHIVRQPHLPPAVLAIEYPFLCFQFVNHQLRQACNIRCFLLLSSIQYAYLMFHYSILCIKMGRLSRVKAKLSCSTLDVSLTCILLIPVHMAPTPSFAMEDLHHERMRCPDMCRFPDQTLRVHLSEAAQMNALGCQHT